MRERFRETMDRLAVAVNRRRSAAPARAVLSDIGVQQVEPRRLQTQGSGYRANLSSDQWFRRNVSLPRIGRATRFTPPML